MNILIYCQHVVGIGHLCRMLEIIRALSDHEVTLILGGPPVDIEIPSHVHIVRLPGIMMDPEYTRMFPVDPSASLEETREKRKRIVLDLIQGTRPDIFMIELYPFGRGAFHVELKPLLDALHTRGQPSCPVVCSLRDILVEKKNQQKYEQRVLDRLGPFAAVLVHGDKNVISLDATFSRTPDIKVPVIYTGYICEKPANCDRAQTRKQVQLKPGEQLVIVSAGGGSFGYPILEAAIKAHANLESDRVRMQVFTGPYLDEEKYTTLIRLAGAGVKVKRFADDFPEQLAASDLSISMGGYNTTMNVVASGTPALIYPYSHDREQGTRAEQLAGKANLQVLSEEDLDPDRLAAKIKEMIGKQGPPLTIQLDGARQTARWLEKLARSDN